MCPSFWGSMNQKRQRSHLEKEAECYFHLIHCIGLVEKGTARNETVHDCIKKTGKSQTT